MSSSTHSDSQSSARNAGDGASARFQTGHAELSVADVTITPELWAREMRPPNITAETAAMRRLADTIATDPTKIFQACVELTLDLCQADTCGISLRERTDKGEDIFRW